MVGLHDPSSQYVCELSFLSFDNFSTIKYIPKFIFLRGHRESDRIDIKGVA